jgi:p24 family protein beta-1
VLSQVKDEQAYIVVRERTHRNTAESTNARVKWWSIFQLGVLIGEGVFQVWWLKRFFEVITPHPIPVRNTADISQVKRVV